MAEAALLTARDLHVEIGGQRVCAGLDLELRPGTSWALLGRNGVGKTTLLLTLAGLRAPARGRVELDGTPLATLARRDIARRVGLLPQEHRDPFPADVLETVLIGRHPHLGGLAWEGPHDLEIARDALAHVGLAEFERRAVTTLSGGERRRVGMATLLAQQPAVALLDEPANHLDLKHQVATLGMLRARITDPGGALAMVLHDVNLACRFCDHVLLLFGDGEVHAGPVAELLDAPTLTRLYGVSVVAVDGPYGRAWLPGTSHPGGPLPEAHAGPRSR